MSISAFDHSNIPSAFSSRCRRDNQDKHTVGPNFAAFGKIAVITEYLGDRAELARRHRIVVFGHNSDPAELIVSYLRGKFRERAGVCDIDHRIGLAAMPVAARYDRQPDRLRQIDSCLILGPRTKTVYFDSVHPFGMLGHKPGG